MEILGYRIFDRKRRVFASGLYLHSQRRQAFAMVRKGKGRFSARAIFADSFDRLYYYQHCKRAWQSQRCRTRERIAA